jgi:hypothetical protein
VRESSISSDPPAALLAALTSVVELWLIRSLLETAARQLRCDLDELSPSLAEDVRQVARHQASLALDAITDLLGTDVDAQRHNPLALLRTAAIASGEVLAQHGIAPVVRDDFEVRTFPGDHYRLVPASWGDVDPSLQEAGITWGAWKAATVMHRRREEGRR